MRGIRSLGEDRHQRRQQEEEETIEIGGS